MYCSNFIMLVAGLLMVSAKHLAGLIPAAYIRSKCNMLCQMQWPPSHIDKPHYRCSTQGRLCTCCLLYFGCCQGDDAVATLTLLCSSMLCVALCVLCLEA